MKPILFSIGNFHLYSFGLLVALGVVLSLFLMERRAKRFGFPPQGMVFDLVLVVVLSGFLGARAAYIVQNFSWYAQHPFSMLAFWEGGLIFYGGVITSFLGVILFSKSKQFSSWRMLDFLLPYVALTHAFGRIGCFMNGCCGGKACGLPWAVTFPDTDLAVHPTQLYESAWNVLLFFFLSHLYSSGQKGLRKSFEGETASLYFFFYGLGRLIVEFFRAGNPYWGVLTVNQWMSLALMAAAAVFYFLKRQQEAGRAQHAGA